MTKKMTTISDSQKKPVLERKARLRVLGLGAIHPTKSSTHDRSYLAARLI
jgi:hypothetical protein